jgi:ribosomal protein L12E/L44/L45/RPP1/RPP2
MPYICPNLGELSPYQKDEMIASLATLIAGLDPEKEISPESISAVATAAGCSVSSDLANLYASVVKLSGTKQYVMAPGGGGGGGGGGAAAGGAPAAAAVKEEEPEEEEMDMGGAVDMFGGGEAKGGDY